MHAIPRRIFFLGAAAAAALTLTAVALACRTRRRAAEHLAAVDLRLCP